MPSGGLKGGGMLGVLQWEHPLFRVLLLKIGNNSPGAEICYGLPKRSRRKLAVTVA